MSIFSLDTSSQYITVGSPNNRRPGKSTCDNSSKTALVEHFFNIIFNEFHTAPPVCVCVQMCPDQPTYCYPNGCLKKAESSKKIEVPVPVTRFSENTKPIFFLEEKNDFMHDLINKNYMEDNKAVPELGRQCFIQMLIGYCMVTNFKVDNNLIILDKAWRINKC